MSTNKNLTIYKDVAMFYNTTVDDIRWRLTQGERLIENYYRTVYGEP